MSSRPKKPPMDHLTAIAFARELFNELHPIDKQKWTQKILKFCLLRFSSTRNTSDQVRQQQRPLTL
jgi:hypothetical protein